MHVHNLLGCLTCCPSYVGVFLGKCKKTFFFLSGKGTGLQASCERREDILEITKHKIRRKMSERVPSFCETRFRRNAGNL